MIRETRSAQESLFWQLFDAVGEDAVDEIVSRTPEMQSDENWYPYGGTSQTDHSNFATFDNQQANPIAALVEKLTNSIDSILLKHCRLAGVNPKASGAPPSISEAVARYFDIRNGDFSEISHADRSRIAENIQIIAAGPNDIPDLLIADNGEGQHPDEFPNTFLSLLKNNKAEIPFVQGKYNMGSTGAVVFCGERKFQLLASRKHPQLRGDRTDEIGFTLVRRHPLSELQERDGSVRFTWFEYFCPDGRVPRFEARPIDVGLYRSKLFESGALVKLYSYQLPPGVRSYIVLNLWRELNHYLYQPALPILLYDPRVPKQRHPVTPMLGNKMRIVLDERDKKECTISMKLVEKRLGEANIDVTIFRHGLSQKEFINEKAVIFTLNGQVQGSLPRAFVSQRLRLPMLKDSMLINVDCEKLGVTARMEIFQANRSNMRESRVFQLLVDEMERLVRENPEIRKIHELRKSAIIQDKSEDMDLITSALKDMRLDKRIVDLLKKNGPGFPSKSQAPRSEGASAVEKERRRLKRFPSIFSLQLKQSAEGKIVKTIPLNGKGTIEFETDVEDEYLFRPMEPGDLKMGVSRAGFSSPKSGNQRAANRAESQLQLPDLFGVTRSGPTNGVIRVTFKPRETLQVGAEIPVNVSLTAPGGDLEALFYVRIAPPQTETPGTKKTENSPASYPAPIKVYEKPLDESGKSWAEYGWNATDVVRVIAAGKSVEAIAINMDSGILRQHLSQKKIKTEVGIKTARNTYFVKVYVHALYMFGSIHALNETNERQIEDVEEYVSHLFKIYGRCMLTLDSMSELEIED